MYSMLNEPDQEGRNARERERVREVNDAFERLRKHIPVVSEQTRRKKKQLRIPNPNSLESCYADTLQEHCDQKRISKARTLQMAIEYIKLLSSQLDAGHTRQVQSSFYDYYSYAAQEYHSQSPCNYSSYLK
ncbi:hypothetical protein Ciccas_009933 [Cichlidogyrus casuarinus]|uniref:BHLH domain-containing protein n=1 Tax=Cichlidogyrus casuarinus TaxID=1844966 RepID=A0ABD2PVK6_9PLAT